MAFEYALARLKPRPSAWNLFHTREEAEASLPALNARPKEPDEDAYRVMTRQEFQTAQEAYWLGDGGLTEITAERYDEMLNVLPPVAWERQEGVERFLMSEFTIGNLTEQYAQAHGRFFCRIVNAHDRSTWITGAEIARHVQAEQTVGA